ncbi:unnamed protein product [Cylindrotheca closterium]|uniref:Uncharacterized protein n=1 Tax=Cylindrotheca closterium TaxID=2856 RepID=A0AAD2FFC7_9STRA|nr:unnamed protein product [Cylindrotheca closterium]
MMTLESVKRLNNQVVSLLDCGLFHEAYQLSLTAMVHFQEMVSMPEISNYTSSSIDEYMVALGNSRGGAAGDFVYQHGITFTSAMVEDPSTITSILIFNSALSHQLLASAMYYKEPASLYQRLLEKAKMLYKLAYSEQRGDYNYIFKLTVLNNIGVICRLLDEEEQAQECFDHLVSLLMQGVVQSGVCDHTTTHFEQFWANLTVKHVAPAA